MSYKDMAFCPAKDCKNWNCSRNTDRPDFRPNGMPVCYADFKSNCDQFTDKRWENPQAGYCFSCRFFATGLECGGKPVGFRGTCSSPDHDRCFTDADDACPFHKPAHWTKEK